MLHTETYLKKLIPSVFIMGRDSSVGIVTHYRLDGSGIETGGLSEIFGNRSDWYWVPPILLYNGCRAFPRVKRPGRGFDHTSHF
jgi:hypothetical protein